MNDPRIEIAARALWEVVPQGMEWCRSVAELQLAALDAARPEVEADAIEQIAEWIWPHVRKLARDCATRSWESVRGGTYAEEVTLDIARALTAVRALEKLEAER